MDTTRFSVYMGWEVRYGCEQNATLSGDGDLLGGLLSGRPGVGDRKDTILHRRLDLLGLTTTSQSINRA